MTNTCISIQGKLLIDKNFTITDGEIIMLPGAEISVSGGRVFTLRNVNQNGGMHGCTAMWKGMFIGNQWAEVHILNSTVQDAQFAVGSNRRFSTIRADGSTFINNSTSIRLWPNIGAPAFNSTILALTGNLFTTNQQYLPGYTGQTPNPANDFMRGVAIWTETSTGVGVGRMGQAANVFDGVTIGILSLNSRVTARNNIFRNIGFDFGGQLSYSNVVNLAIRAEQGNNGYQAHGLLVSDNTFDNCSLGIRAVNTPTTIERNSFTSCKFGISIHDPINRSIQINDNPNIHSGLGIGITGTGPAQQIHIGGNKLNISSSFTTSNLGLLGIFITPWNGTLGNNVLVEDNTVNCLGNHISGALQWGILLQKTSGIVRRCNINIHEAGVGLLAISSVGAVFDKNKVLKNGQNATTGIFLENTPFTDVMCNELNATTCLWVEGPSDCITNADGTLNCTQIRGNILTYIASSNYATQGLYLRNAITSQQKWQGNAWYSVDVPSISDYGAVYVGDALLAPLSKFTTHSPFLPWHPRALVNNSLIDATIWFDNAPGPYFECPPMLTDDNDGGGDEVLDIFEHYAEGAFETAGYGKGARWIADRHLYRNLKTAPTLAASSPVLQQFYTAAQTSALGKLYEVEQGLQALNLIPEAVKAELDALSEEEKELSKELEDLITLPAPTNARDLAALETARTEAAEAFDIVASEIQTIYNTLEAVRLNKRQQLQAFNAGIAATEVPAQYVKTVYTIALAHAADHSELTPAERSLLEPIAALCPSEGGDAVYSARALLGWLQHDNCNELPELSLQQALPQINTTAPLETWGIFPNPGHDDFSILTPTTPSGRVELKIYDIMGHTVFRSLIPAGERSALQLPFLRGGLYLYEVSDAGQRLLVGKLSKLD